MSERNEPIRIAQIVGKWKGGGVEAVVLNYYKNIDKTKIQFDFYFDADSELDLIPVKEIEDMGGKIFIIPPYQKPIAYRKALKKKLKEGQYQIVHSHLNTLSIFPLSAAKRARVPVRIAHSHSTSNKNEKVKNIVKNILRKFSKVYPNVYFACSELAGRYQFGDKTFDEGKVHIINNAVDLNKFKFDEELRKNKREELGISDDTFVVGHIGRFVEQKNHKYLIDIYNEINKLKPNSILLLVGHGPLMDEVKNKVNELGLTDKVRFLGQRDDVVQLYQAFDIFLLPSLYEGLPVVGVEAQATGLKCYLSSAMTKETKILDTTTFIDLETEPAKWASIIIDDYGDGTYSRTGVKPFFVKKCLEIETEAKKLGDLYLEMLNK